MAYRSVIPGSVPGSGSGSSLHFLNSPFGDTTFTKVFVGGLAWETQSETLRRNFEQYGEILEEVVISDKNTGRSKGYGFVTFRDAESARRACVDSSPIIDGRRANCNLASLGRPRPALPYEPFHPEVAGHKIMAASSDFAYVRPPSPYFGGFPVPRGVVGGSSSYHHAVPFGYQQAYPYPPFGYTAYGPEYVYPQNVFNPYTGHQYVQVYGLPGAANTAVYPFGQLGQPVPSGHGYTTIQGYTVPGQHILQLSGPSVNGVTAAPLPTIQAPYPTGVPPSIPAQPQFFVPAPSPQFAQGSGSDQTAS